MKKNIIFILWVGAAMITSCGGAANRSGRSDSKEDHANTIQMTTADFLKVVFDYESNPEEWIYLGDKPALIDFYADWCAPCKIVAPILEELAGVYAGEIYVYKVDTERERELAAVFGITAIPSLLLIPMDEFPQMIRGAQPREVLVELIEEFLLQ